MTGRFIRSLSKFFMWSIILSYLRSPSRQLWQKSIGGLLLSIRWLLVTCQCYLEHFGGCFGCHHHPYPCQVHHHHIIFIVIVITIIFAFVIIIIIVVVIVAATIVLVATVVSILDRVIEYWTIFVSSVIIIIVVATIFW